MEEDLNAIELQIAQLEQTKGEKVEESYNIDTVVALTKYFLDNLTFLLLESPNPIRRATYFSLLFNEAPTYKELIGGTPKLAHCIKLNDEYKGNKGQLARLLGDFSNQYYEYFTKVYDTLQYLQISLATPR